MIHHDKEGTFFSGRYFLSYGALNLRWWHNAGLTGRVTRNPFSPFADQIETLCLFVRVGECHINKI
jgi:hypothetical protein